MYGQYPYIGQMASHHMPSDLAGALLQPDFEHTAVYVELERLCEIRPGAGWERILSALPTRGNATSLSWSTAHDERSHERGPPSRSSCSIFSVVGAAEYSHDRL